MARGDLIEVTPTSYGVMTRAFHFWSGEGRGDESGSNLYENFAEATLGKGTLIPEGAFTLDAAENMENAAQEEEKKDKEIKAGIGDGTRSAPGAGARRLDGLDEGGEEGEEEDAVDSDEARSPSSDDGHAMRSRASESGHGPADNIVSDLRI
jgi:6-phosphofructo-2-kinase/fructose-2,6-biphosphatase 4